MYFKNILSQIFIIIIIIIIRFSFSYFNRVKDRNALMNALSVDMSYFKNDDTGAYVLFNSFIIFQII